MSVMDRILFSKIFHGFIISGELNWMYIDKLPDEASYSVYLPMTLVSWKFACHSFQQCMSHSKRLMWWGLDDALLSLSVFRALQPIHHVALSVRNIAREYDYISNAISSENSWRVGSGIGLTFCRITRLKPAQILLILQRICVICEGSLRHTLLSDTSHPTIDCHRCPWITVIIGEICQILTAPFKPAR